MQQYLQPACSFTTRERERERASERESEREREREREFVCVWSSLPITLATKQNTGNPSAQKQFGCDIGNPNTKHSKA